MENECRENNGILLSIIIPTKNRQYTCLYAIESVLNLGKPDVEIIIRDCSDTDILKTQIENKFGTNNGIVYEYTDTNPSMTDNWNRAFELATGIYKCGIGDDDAVLPNIYELAVFALENDIDALGHSKQYEYFWADYTAIPGYASRLVLVNPSVAPNYKIYGRAELDRLLRQQAATPGMDYRKLPMVYHCLISSRVINKLILKTGKFLDGTSLDVYSAFSLGLYVNQYYVSGVPFTLPGACGLSNSNRTLQKKESSHFSEFKNIVSDKRIPSVQTLTFSIAESTQKAFINCGEPQYSLLLDLPYLYVQFMAESFATGTFRKIFKLMRENNFSFSQYARFFLLFSGKIVSSIKQRTVHILKRLPGIKNKERPMYEAPDILSATVMIPMQAGGMAPKNNG